ncbi:hypothetical protein RJ639_038711 [Escallonia herrerae]|uniref:Uncharacterized protein n=1 Tax=Escallonia herrerae TaxID=1293975 RepID=A0AA88WLR0_9ASTE|nr:hypothetical protein RJ639_038711 [Escallonia herrerae]
MEAVTSASIKMMNQDLIKLDQFDNSNFGLWQDKVKFLLTALRIVYILNCEPLLEPGDNASENEKKEWQRRNDDEVMCRSHILNALSDRLYNFYKSFDSAKEIWKALEYKYKVQEEGTNKFLISEYNDFTMLDGIPILHQVHELQDIANKICELDGKLPESFQIGMIIAKLPPSWKVYRKKLLHREKKFTLEKIQKHLHIEEESRNRDKTGEVEFNYKVNYIDAASGKSFHALQVKKEDNIDVKTYTEAVTSRDATFWKEAINDEIDSIVLEKPKGSYVTVVVQRSLQRIYLFEEVLYVVVSVASVAALLHFRTASLVVVAAFFSSDSEFHGRMARRDLIKETLPGEGDLPLPVIHVHSREMADRGMMKQDRKTDGSNTSLQMVQECSCSSETCIFHARLYIDTRLPR